MFFKRQKEIKNRLNEARANQLGETPTTLKDRDALQAMVDSYLSVRERILDDALLFLKEEGWSAEKQRSNWENHLSNKSTEALRPLTDGLRNKLATPFVVAISEFVTQESRFFMRLANMPLCDQMYARPIEYRKQFEYEKKSLLEKWNSLQNENKNINASIDEISQTLLKVYKDGLAKVGSLKDNIRNEIKTYAKVIAVAGKIVSVSIPGTVTQSIGLMMDAINLFMPKSKELSSRFDQLYRSEENVAVIMFGNTRRSVKEFLEKTNLDKCQAEYSNALKSALDNADNMFTEAQKQDAREFVEEAEKLTRKPLVSFTDAYNGFVNEFREIFVGPVGDRTVRDLIRKERWDWAKGELQQLNIQTELKKIYDDTRDWINIDMFELTPEVKAEIVAALKAERDRLDLALSQAGDRSVLDSIGLYMSVVKETTFNKVKNS